MITKTMKVKQSSFRKLDDPFENGKSKKVHLLCQG